MHGRVTMKKEKHIGYASPYFCIAVTMVVVILVKMIFYFAASRVTSPPMVWWVAGANGRMVSRASSSE